MKNKCHWGDLTANSATSSATTQTHTINHWTIEPWNIKGAVLPYVLPLEALQSHNLSHNTLVCTQSAIS